LVYYNYVTACPFQNVDISNSLFQHVFCVYPNGTIMINRYISETLSGFFVIPVKVRDAGGEDVTNVTVRLASYGLLCD